MKSRFWQIDEHCAGSGYAVSVTVGSETVMVETKELITAVGIVSSEGPKSDADGFAELY